MSLDATGVLGKVKDVGSRVLDVRDAVVQKVREAPKKLWETLKDLGSGGPAKRWWAQRRIQSLGTRIHRSNDRALGLRVALATLREDPVKNRRKIERYTKQLARHEQGVRSRTVERQNYAKGMQSHYDARLARPKEVIELQGRLEQRIHDFEKKRDAFSVALERFAGNMESEHYKKVAETFARLDSDIDAAKRAHVLLGERVGRLKEAYTDVYARVDYFGHIAKDGAAEIQSEDDISRDLSGYDVNATTSADREYRGVVATDEPRAVNFRGAEPATAEPSRMQRLRENNTLPRGVTELLRDDATLVAAVYLAKGIQRDLLRVLGSDRMRSRMGVEHFVDVWNIVCETNSSIKPITDGEKMRLRQLHRGEKPLVSELCVSLFALNPKARPVTLVREGAKKVAQEIKGSL